MKIQLKKAELLIIDADYICHRAYHAYTNPMTPASILKTRSGILSGVFFGFFSLLLRKIEEYDPTIVAVAWGDQRDNLWRKDVLPTYKHGRSIMPDEFRSQIEDIKLALCALPVDQYFSPRYEADDIIAKLVQVAKEVGKKGVYIATRDKDMFQLVDSTTTVLNLGVKANVRDEEFTPDKVEEKFGVGPELIADYLSLIGDTADGIDGVKGIGPKTAVDILKKNGPIKTWYCSIPSINASEKVKSSLWEAREQLYINKRVISLKNAMYKIELQTIFYDVDLKFCTELFDKYQMQKIRPENFITK